MMKKIVLISLILGPVFSGCKREKAITPTEKFDNTYTLPQGNHDYDEEIVALFNQYKSYFLYKFDVKDFYWSQTLIGGSENEPFTYKNYFYVEPASKPADENYIKPALAFLKNNWLAYYPDAFLTKYLPLRILLADSLNAIRNIPATGPINAMPGFHQMTVGNISPKFGVLTADQRLRFKSDLHFNFWVYVYKQSGPELPAAFFEAGDYVTAVTAAKQAERGFLSTLGGVYGQGPWSWTKQQIDYMDYIKAITSTPKATLEATILKPTTDKNGLIRLKYNIITKFYAEKYNLDLQKIGDSPVVN